MLPSGPMAAPPLSGTTGEISCPLCKTGPPWRGEHDVRC